MTNYLCNYTAGSLGSFYPPKEKTEGALAAAGCVGNLPLVNDRWQRPEGAHHTHNLVQPSGPPLWLVESQEPSLGEDRSPIPQKRGTGASLDALVRKRPWRPEMSYGLWILPAVYSERTSSKLTCLKPTPLARIASVATSSDETLSRPFSSPTVGQSITQGH